jgi:hypothetical protein
MAVKVRVEGEAISEDHRAGRMLAALVASENTSAKVVLTTVVKKADGGQALHETFTIKRWVNDEQHVMLSVKSGHYPSDRTVLVVNVLEGGKTFTAKACRGDQDRLLVYAAEAALDYAWTGRLPQPKNGSVDVKEASQCGYCGKKLTDPVSIERGIGPDCLGKTTGSKTISGAVA